MKKICSWCKCVIDEKKDNDEKITHGICKKCFDIVMKEIEERIAKK